MSTNSYSAALIAANAHRSAIASASRTYSGLGVRALLSVAGSRIHERSVAGDTPISSANALTVRPLFFTARLIRSLWVLERMSLAYLPH